MTKFRTNNAKNFRPLIYRFVACPYFSVQCGLALGKILSLNGSASQVSVPVVSHSIFIKIKIRWTKIDLNDLMSLHLQHLNGPLTHMIFHSIERPISYLNPSPCSLCEYQEGLYVAGSSIGQFMQSTEMCTLQF